MEVVPTAGKPELGPNRRGRRRCKESPDSRAAMIAPVMDARGGRCLAMIVLRVVVSGVQRQAGLVPGEGGSTASPVRSGPSL